MKLKTTSFWSKRVCKCLFAYANATYQKRKTTTYFSLQKIGYQNKVTVIHWGEKSYNWQPSTSFPSFLRGKKMVDHTKGTGLTLSFDCTILSSIDTYQTVSSSFAPSACSSSRMMGYETTESLLPFHWKMSVPQSAGSYSSYPFPPSQVRIPD